MPLQDKQYATSTFGLGEDAGVLLNTVIYTVSGPLSKQRNSHRSDMQIKQKLVPKPRFVCSMQHARQKYVQYVVSIKAQTTNAQNNALRKPWQCSEPCEDFVTIVLFAVNRQDCHILYESLASQTYAQTQKHT